MKIEKINSNKKEIEKTKKNKMSENMTSCIQ